VAQVPAGIIHSRSQGKPFWREMRSEGDSSLFSLSDDTGAASEHRGFSLSGRN